MWWASKEHILRTFVVIVKEETVDALKIAFIGTMYLTL